MTKVEKYREFNTSRAQKKFLENNRIPKSDMTRWQNQYHGWCDLTRRQQKQFFVRSNQKGKGIFHPQEKKVHKTYMEWRAQGYLVTKKRLGLWMKFTVKEDNPPHYKPCFHTFGPGWQKRFCSRWRISLQRKTKRKTTDVFRRLHKIKNYHYWLIYMWQDPWFYENPYFTFNNYVEKHIANLIEDEPVLELNGSSSSASELDDEN